MPRRHASATSAEAVRAGARPSYAAQTIDRGLAILGCFSQSDALLSVQDIRDRLGMPYSTAHRYLTTLEAGGYVQRSPRSGLYRLGLRLVEHAGVVLNQLDVRLHALPELDALADELRLNANLAVLFEGDTFHIEYAIRSQVPRMYTTVGRRAVAHCTALGKCLLAGLPREEVHAWIAAKGWRPYTPDSIQDFERLDREIDGVLEHGYAIDREERARRQICVGAPIRDRTGTIVAAMSVSAPAARMRGEQLDHVIEAVMARSDRVSYRMGHEPLLTIGPSV